MRFGETSPVSRSDLQFCIYIGDLLQRFLEKQNRLLNRLGVNAVLGRNWCSGEFGDFGDNTVN